MFPWFFVEVLPQLFISPPNGISTNLEELEVGHPSVRASRDYHLH